MAGVNKEFLEEALKATVDRFVVNKGSNLGDGFTCLMFSVDVWTNGSLHPKPILIKCFPTNPIRQQVLDAGGLFMVELRMYDTILPELVQFQRDHNTGGGLEDFKLPFAPFVAGREIPLEQRNGPALALDNYLIMPDLRKDGGFTLRDRFQGLDVEHVKLVLKGQAILHATSWAFRVTKGKSFVELYSYLNCAEYGARAVEKFLEGFPETIARLMDVFKDEEKIQNGLSYVRSIVFPAVKRIFSIPLSSSEKSLMKDLVPDDNEEPWSVLRHGDCWSNNLLFRYDKMTGKPLEVVFIDLQLCHEGDLFNDICYTIFCNTPRDVRQQHLQSLLRIYFDTFTQVCEGFGVKCLPGWSWEEFNRRFKRTQIMGISLAAGALPIMLQDPNNVKDLEMTDMMPEGEVDEMSMKKLLNAMRGADLDIPVMKDRIRGVIQDGIDAGII